MFLTFYVPNIFYVIPNIMFLYTFYDFVRHFVFECVASPVYLSPPLLIKLIFNCKIGNIMLYLVLQCVVIYNLIS